MEPDSLDQHAQVVEKGKVQKGESTGDRYISKGERERGGQVGTAKKLRQRQVLSQFLAGRKGKALRQEIIAFLLHSRKGDLEFPSADTWCFLLCLLFPSEILQTSLILVNFVLKQSIETKNQPNSADQS